MANATIDWGDGTTIQNVAVTPSGATNAWSFTNIPHTYAASGTYQVRLTGPAAGVDQKPATVLVEVVTVTVAVAGAVATTGGTGHT
jgi:hypothetical protein